MMFLQSRLTATSDKCASPTDCQLVWQLSNGSPQTLYLFRDRFDPSEYDTIPEHPLTGTELVLFQGGEAIPYLVSEGGPIGLKFTPKVAHYLSLRPGESYYYIFKGLHYTVFSSDQPFRHQTFQWTQAYGEIGAQVVLESRVRDQELNLAIWTGQVLSNTIFFEITKEIEKLMGSDTIDS